MPRGDVNPQDAGTSKAHGSCIAETLPRTPCYEAHVPRKGSTGGKVPMGNAVEESGRHVMTSGHFLRLCVLYNSSSWSTNCCCSGVSTARGIKRRTHWRASAPERPKHRFAR